MHVGQVRFLPAATCVAFGLVLGATPAGPQVNDWMTVIGDWLWVQVQAL